jgi:hypothetical protein
MSPLDFSSVSLQREHKTFMLYQYRYWPGLACKTCRLITNGTWLKEARHSFPLGRSEVLQVLLAGQEQ